MYKEEKFTTFSNEKTHMNVDILDRLEDYCGKDYVPMHMPGAKRNTDLFKMGNPYGLDITEIDGFDNMHHATDIIKEAFERASKVFGADETLFLVNGSSAGILSAICGATRKGDSVLVARNCHVSVYNAIYLNELNPVYIYPEPYNSNKVQEDILNEKYSNIESDCLEYDNNNQLQKVECNDKSCNIIDSGLGIYGKVYADDIEKHLKENENISTVIITSPTYEGIVSDIKSIACVVHRYGKVLIVDEAHGAHLHFHKDLPESAVDCGADAVIQSIHKTLPSFTQTALLHLNGKIIDRDKVKHYWNIYQSTSPSYLLLAGIDRCVSIIQENGKELFDNYVYNLKCLRKRLSKLKYIKLLDVDDISKIVLATWNGKGLHDILLKYYHIELEMSSLKYIIAMTSIADKVEYYERFAQALEQIDELIEEQLLAIKQENILNSSINNDKLYNTLNKYNCNTDTSKNVQLRQDILTKIVYYNKALKNVGLIQSIGENSNINNYSGLYKANVKLNIYKALTCDNKEKINLYQAQGKISANTVCFYPPGIPLVNPGEIITKEVIDYIISGLNTGLEVMGLDIENIELNNCKDEELIRKGVYLLCLK